MAKNATTRGVPRVINQGLGPTVPTIGASQIPTINYSTGSAKALQQFSRDMFSLSNQFEDQIDEQAAAEASTQGALDGMSGNVALQTYETIRGRAYNKAAMETLAATTETTSIVRLAEIQTKYAADPVGMQAAIENYTAGQAAELSKLDPAAAAMYRQRMVIRGLPAVEAAKDNAFKLTKAQADAALIENEQALKLEVKNNASDLFSDNPERSRAAAQAIGMVQNEYMKIYGASDPVTGRPLYSPEEVAKAKKKFTDTVMTSATLSWFDQQPDKSSAYLRFTSGKFAIKINNVGGTSKVIMANANSTRNDPLKEGLRAQLSTAASALGEGYDVIVHSGGQETEAEVAAGLGARTGSPRHDHGGAGDVRLGRNGQVIPFAGNRELYKQFAQNLAAAGVSGIGVDEQKGYLHAGGGSQASWGYGKLGGKHMYLPKDFEAAIEAGRKGEKLESKPTTSEFNVRDALGATALDGLESEMRARITFNNQMIDRKDKAEAEELKTRQDLAAFELTSRIFDRSPGVQAVTPREIGEAVRSGVIDADKGAAMSKALAVDKPQKSDEPTLRDINARIFAGENVYRLILDNADKLTVDDTASLLAKNQQHNGTEKGVFDKEQKFQFDLLSDQVAGQGPFDKYDQGKVDRAVAAKDEFRARVLDPENVETPEAIRRDIVSRAVSDNLIADRSKLGRFVRPRFSVSQPNNPNRLDIDASTAALLAAYDAKTISDAALARELQRLEEWEQTQIAVTAAEEAAKNQKAK